MGRLSELLIVQQEELHDLRKEYDSLQSELAFLEHEQSYLERKIYHIQDLLFEKEQEIHNQLDIISITIREDTEL